VTTAEERTLPHNLEAERSILGAVLARNAALDSITDVITPHMFFRDAHRRVYRAMLALLRSRRRHRLRHPQRGASARR
jgi:replicative DNA helicase